jgi:hypothetical protein
MYYPTLALIIIMPELLDAIGYICKSSGVYDGVVIIDRVDKRQGLYFLINDPYNTPKLRKHQWHFYL